MMISNKGLNLPDSRMIFRFIHHNPSLNKKEAGLSEVNPKSWTLY